MNDFHDQVITRNETVDGLGPWYWLKDDNGAWDGPKMDWETSHKNVYFQKVQKYDVVVQAGGCLGMYPRLLARNFTKVYTFEPDPLNFHVLTLNCQDPNIVKFNCALGHEHFLVSLHRRSTSNVGMHGISLRKDEKIPVMMIDDLALDECDMICLDVESYESAVLLGALNTIDKFRPVITCENGNDDILNILSPYGYDTHTTSVSDTIYYKNR